MKQEGSPVMFSQKPTIKNKSEPAQPVHIFVLIVLVVVIIIVVFFLGFLYSFFP
jgi:hypothetical protein